MNDPTVAVLRITARDDIVRALRRTVGRTLKQGCRTIVVIMHHDDGLDYEQIQSLVSVDRTIRRAGGMLSLVVMRADLQFIFRLLGLYEHFNFVERVEQIARPRDASKEQHFK